MKDDCQAGWGKVPRLEYSDCIVTQRVNPGAKEVYFSFQKSTAHPLNAWKVKRAQTIAKGRKNVRSSTVCLHDFKAFFALAVMVVFGVMFSTSIFLATISISLICQMKLR